MGRFYKTAMVTPMDYAYRMNEPLMEKVIQYNDAGVGSIYNEADTDRNALNFAHNSWDDEDVKKVTDNYNKQINDIVSNIQNGNAKDWRKQLQPLRDLKYKLSNDIQSGPISKYIASYNNRKSFFDDIDKQVDLYNKTGGKDKDGNSVGVSPIEGELMKDSYDNDYTSKYHKTFDNATGKYNIYSGGPIVGSMDLQDYIDKISKNVLANKGSFSTSNTNGAYFNDVTKSWEKVTPDMLIGAIMSQLLSDTKVRDYLSSRQNIGYLNGYTYKNDIVDNNGNILHKQGDFISPYNTVYPNQNSDGTLKLTQDQQKIIDNQQSEINKTKIKDPKKAAEMQKDLDEQKENLRNQQDIQWDNNSILSSPIRASISKYAYDNENVSNKLRYDPSYGARLSAQTSLQTANIRAQSAERVAKINQDGATSRLMMKEQWDLDHPKESSTKSSSKLNTTPTQNTYSNFKSGDVVSSNKFTQGDDTKPEDTYNDWWKSTNKLQDDLKDYNSKINSEKNPEIKNKLIKDRNNTQLELNNNINTINAIRRKAFTDNGVSYSDDNTYLQSNTLTDKKVNELEKQAENFNQKNIVPLVNKINNSRYMSKLDKDDMINNLNSLKNTYQSMKDNISNIKSKHENIINSIQTQLSDNLKNQSIQTDGRALSNDAVKSIVQTLIDNGQDINIYDPKDNKQKDMNFINNDGDNKNYINPSDIKINAAYPTGINKYNQNIALSFTYKGKVYKMDDPNGKLTNIVANDWLKSNNADAKILASRIVNPLSKDVNKIVFGNEYESNYNKNNQGTVGVTHSGNIYLNDGNNTIPIKIHITPHSINNGNDLSYEVQTEINGKLMDLHPLDNNGNEAESKIFHDTDQITDALESLIPTKN